MRNVLLVIAMLAIANCKSMIFYDVTIEEEEDCRIVSNGALCDEGDEVETQTWAVDVRETKTVVYQNGIAWVADNVEGEQRAEFLKKTIDNIGPCETNIRKVLFFTREEASISGSILDEIRTEGPSSCGETPHGQKKIFQFKGTTRSEF